MSLRPSFAPGLARAACALCCLVALPAAAAGSALDHPVWASVVAAHDAAWERAAATLRAAEVALGRAEHGVRGRIEARPSLTAAGRPGRDAEFGAALGVTARVDWTLDPAARASAALAHHRALVGALEGAHREARAASTAYLSLRRALVAVAVAEAAVTSRRVTFERAEASLLGAADAPAAAGPLELELARLELERATAAVRRAQRDVAEAAHAAARYAVDVAAAEAAHRDALGRDPLEGWRLVVPWDAVGPPGGEPPEVELLSVERRALELDLALARERRQGAAALLDDVRLEAAWSGTDARLRFALALDEGRPGGFAEASAPGAARASWSIGLRARIRIADGWADDLARAEAGVLEARRALADEHGDALWAWGELVRAVEDAEEDVAFAERSLALGRAALAQLDDERRGVAAAARAGEPGGEERLRRFDDAYARSLLGHLRERDAFLRAWERYLRAAERAWIAVGAPFEVRPVAPAHGAD